MDYDKMIAEEHADAEKYDALAKENPRWYGMLKTIANEERTHAEHLQYMKEHDGK